MFWRDHEEVGGMIKFPERSQILQFEVSRDLTFVRNVRILIPSN
jgi:hypothetical protein